VKVIYALLFILLIPLTALTAQSDKIDPALLGLIRENTSSDVRIIVELIERPTNEQIEVLKEDGMNVTHVYRIINAVAGTAPAGKIERIAGHPWVKKVWFDRTVRALEENEPKNGTSENETSRGIIGEGLPISIPFLLIALLAAVVLLNLLQIAEKR
jgi:hypothetical protein